MKFLYYLECPSGENINLTFPSALSIGTVRIWRYLRQVYLREYTFRALNRPDIFYRTHASPTHAHGCPRGHFCVYVDTNIVTLKLCKFQITGYNSNRYHFLPGSTAVPRVRIFISVAKTKSELSRSPLGSWAERPQEVRAEQDGARSWG